ncbi:TetR/AcrR family transcriptional regulator [Hoeflea sp. WL0058]|uniref:TetR/AcrR family transcriptional regulator n=1 Tax=Flavimaribacter sediminis TaxID=2865987 RepID=A0AAE2ZNU2_9HYPH|nr:TetR/AcrR family transcriptional regulator [Flavimaribacter sediminis]MBW8639993.1 TetR/AcrR family transcriptional regulator [Flavimaribacter sediminis]
MRRHIADCALRLFQEDGYDAVSMRRLASEAGCTVMTLYRYFDRKIDILRALWTEVFAELFDRLDRVAAGEADPTHRLLAVSQGYVDFWLERREHYFLVFMSSGVTQSDVSVFVGDDGVVSRFNVLRESLAGALDGRPGEAELKLKSELLLCALNGIAHNLITISAYPWSEPQALVRAAVTAVLTRPE